MAGTFPRRIFLMDFELLPDGFLPKGLTSYLASAAAAANAGESL
jgi:hypothetical protein